MTRPWWITGLEILVYGFIGAVVAMGAYLWIEERSHRRGGR